MRLFKHIVRTGVGLAFLTATTACDFHAANGREDGVALRTPLTSDAGGDLARPFTVTRDGTYVVSLEFAWPIANTEAAELFERAAADVGTGHVPVPFDFRWQVLEAGEQITNGSSRQGAIGLIDSSDTAMGHGRPTRRALVFGTFPARVGVRYTLRLSPGPAIGPLLHASPLVRVEIEASYDADLSR
jgi:hypothetical protein